MLQTGQYPAAHHECPRDGRKIQSCRSERLWEYPEIIRNNLVAKTVSNINILGKDIIDISTSLENNQMVYNISTAYDTKNVSRPNYASPANWGNIKSADEIFNDLFRNILPNVRGVHAGDMTTTDSNGYDTKQWYNSLFEMSGMKDGLQSNAKYLRLYLTSQPEPIYIYINADSVSDMTNGYNLQSSETVSIIINDIDKTMTANISYITDDQINSLI